MRAPNDAGPASWPLRILRPWLVATVSGGALGALLLSVSPSSRWNELDYLQMMPRAAVHDTRADNIAADDSFSAPALASALEEFGLAPAPGRAGAVNAMPPLLNPGDAP